MTARHNRRMFRHHRRRRATLLAALAIIVAGCAQTVADWKPVETPHAVQVKWITHEHAISLNRQQGALSKMESRSLDRFLGEIDLNPTDRVFVDVGSKPGEVVDDTRIGVINDQLRHFVPNADATVIVGEKGNANNVQLIVGRYVAVAPNCPDMSKPSDRNPGNFNDSNYGCTTQRNLGLMLANPGDLLRGRTLGPGDGEALSRGIRAYRAGEAITPELPKQD